MMYSDDNRLTWVTYPGGADTYMYDVRRRHRATFSRTVRGYIYDRDRVLEETQAWVPQARYTLESGSYYSPWLRTWLSTGESRYPMYDGLGTARRLADGTGTFTDGYLLNAFGRQLGIYGSTRNPYRYDGAWGYQTDTTGSGLLQLGARFYWPEIGRFIQQDPFRRGNRYVYARNNPLALTDPTGLTDIVFPIEADIATPWGGIDASAGIVIDTDNLWHSGVYSSGGPAKGLSLGLNVGIGVVPYGEIEGEVGNVDLNLGPVSPTVQYRGDEWTNLDNVTGASLTAGIGLGASVSHTVTETITVECMWAWLKGAAKRVHDLLW